MKKTSGSLIGYFSRLVVQKGGINLAQGKPGFPPPSELLQILKKKSGHHHLQQYAPGNGDFDLLNLLAKQYSQYSPVKSDNFVVVQGATEGIFLTFFYLTTRLLSPYSALSFTPVYESYPELAKTLNIPFEYFDFEKDLTINFKRLEEVIREKKVKIVFVTSPGNPLGKVWEKDEVTKLITLSKKMDFFIIFDAVYMDIFFHERPFNPLQVSSIFKGYDKLFYIGSFSKMLSITGWRIGYVIAEKTHMAKIRAIHDYTGLCAPTLFQSVIVDYLSQFNFGIKYLDSIRSKCRQSYLFMKGVLEELNFTIPEIGGGYFLWAGLPDNYQDGYRFALELYKRVKVGIVPGENFSHTQKQYVRINIALDFSVIQQGAGKIKSFFSNG
ncbi:MAG: pyridoxal phosphate-dependent aminotransferase [Candidatus Aminicenantes bacterium]|nr:pyridoxal phosphate-dependent aminotransferase [Candidatus Aminicenantes bacterium]